ncbi:MAG: lamin tail domain-containing protein [Planctomycetota bacterium]
MSRHRCALTAALAGAAIAGLAAPARAGLIITEVMYNPASADGTWEWIEVHNSGGQDVDLAGWVLDDDDGTPLVGSNIAAGVVPAGGTAVLYDAGGIGAAEFTAAWGAGINAVGVTSWSSLNNTGDRVGLWPGMTWYGTREFPFAAVDLAWAVDDPWPSSDNAGSIALASGLADPGLGASWSLSVLGDGVSWASLALGGNLGGDVGSPGVAVPAPAAWLALAGAAMIRRRRRR